MQLVLWEGVPTLVSGDTDLGWGGVPTLARGIPTLAMLVPTLAGVPTLTGGIHTLAGGAYLGQGGTDLGWGGTYLGQGGTYLGWGGLPTLVLGGYLPWLGGTYLGQNDLGVNRQMPVKTVPSAILRMRTVIKQSDKLLLNTLSCWRNGNIRVFPTLY